MMRRHVEFSCDGRQLVGTLDAGTAKTGLLIVSGGNEIRSGAHAGQAQLAQDISGAGYPVFRYDRRGIGDSEGANAGFLDTEADIAAAMEAFRAVVPHMEKVVAFGNCDAATALALFHETAGIGALVLANPWVIENDRPDALPPPSAVRSRYIEKIRDPKKLIELFTGKVSFTKLAKGLKQAVSKPEQTGLSARLGEALADADIPVRILLARRDRTALAFQEAWANESYNHVAAKPNIALAELDSASHSFADAEAKKWLRTHIIDMLES